MSHLPAYQILILFGAIAPLTALIGVWALVDMNRLIRNVRGEA